MSIPRCLPIPTTEKQFLAQVIDLARIFGWKHYHTHDSRRSTHGWPDLAFARPPRFILAELKTERGKLTAWQQEWIDVLKACGIETYLWRPSMLDDIVRLLK